MAFHDCPAIGELGSVAASNSLPSVAGAEGRKLLILSNVATTTAVL